MKTFKKEGKSYKISNDILDDQTTLQVSSDTETKATINTDEFEDFKKLYADAIKNLTDIYGNLFPDLENAEDLDKALKDAFTKSKNYMPSEEMKPSGELDDKLKVEESVKITESDEEDLDEAFYEKVCRAYIDTMNLEWVTTNPENNNSVVHGIFKDDEIAQKWGYGDKVTPENFKDAAYDGYTQDEIDNLISTMQNHSEWDEYDTWEDFYYEYVNDNIAYDLNDIGLHQYVDTDDYDFYLSVKDLKKLGFDLSNTLEEAVITNDSNIAYKDWLDSKAFWVNVYDNYGCDSWTDINNRLSEDDLKSLYQKYLQDPNKNYDLEFADLTENCHKKIERKCSRKTCKTEDLKASEKELADKFGITDNLNKLTNDLMSLDDVENVNYDLNGYLDGINGPITLVAYKIDNSLSVAEQITKQSQLLKDIYKVFADNGVIIEKDETEDNDTYFYFVSYQTNWNTEKKTESPVHVPTKEQLYDEMCHVLTDYENNTASGDDLYSMLVKIQNRWEDVITAEE